MVASIIVKPNSGPGIQGSIIAKVGDRSPAPPTTSALPNIHVGPTAPASPNENDVWIDTN